MKNKAAPPPALTPRNLRPKDFAYYRELWRAAENREFLSAYPLHLDLELTSHCNLRCRMCWQSKDISTAKGFMNDGLFKRLIDEGVEKGLASIKLQLRGESLLHPRVAELTRYAKDAGVLDVQITTNGTVFATRPGLIEELIKAGLDKIVFSIDPQHDESALQIYGPDNQPDAAQALKDTIEARRAMGRSRPLVRVQTIIRNGQTPKQRLGEVKALFADADEYFINPLWNSTWDEDALPGLATDYEFMPCTHLWTRLAVYWDGRAFMCVRDYNERLPLGDTNTESVKDIWLGKTMTGLRRAHLEGRRRKIKLCGHCDMCTRPRKGLSRPRPIWLQADD